MRHQILEQKDTWLEELGTNPLLCILGSCLGHQTFPLILLYWSVQAALRCLEVLAKARTLLGSPCSVKQPKIQENKTILVWLQGPVAGQSQSCLPASGPAAPGHTVLVRVVTGGLFAFQPVPLLVSGTASPSTP